MKLNFKFKNRSTSPQRTALLSQLTRHGAASVGPLFPGQKDSELAGLFVADYDTSEAMKRALDLLKESDAVEFAEPSPVRKLIR